MNVQPGTTENLQTLDLNSKTIGNIQMEHNNNNNNNNNNASYYKMSDQLKQLLLYFSSSIIIIICTTNNTMTIISPQCCWGTFSRRLAPGSGLATECLHPPAP